MAENPKVVGHEIYELALAKKVKFPSTLTEVQREQKCFNIGQISKDEDGVIDRNKAVEELVSLYGLVEEKTDDKKRKAEDENDSPVKQKKTETFAFPDNEGIALALREIAGFYYKEGEKFKGGVYSKAAKSIREFPSDVFAKDAKNKPIKIAGIGKSIQGLMDEFKETGQIKKLEELRAKHA